MTREEMERLCAADGGFIYPQVEELRAALRETWERCESLRPIVEAARYTYDCHRSNEVVVTKYQNTGVNGWPRCECSTCRAVRALDAKAKADAP